MSNEEVPWIDPLHISLQPFLLSLHPFYSSRPFAQRHDDNDNHSSFKRFMMVYIGQRE
jgi:hypothetical protein